MTDRPRRRAAASDTASREAREDNPFAPPPEGQPDQPWQPRRPAGRESSDGSGSGNGTGGGSGDDQGQGSGPNSGSSSGSDEERERQWGRWSSNQPGRQSGGFGGQGGGPQGTGGEGGPDGGVPRGGMRWDPTDPLQRHARYALHAGIWGLFFALFSLPPVALLLGALSLYWGISALRGRSATAAEEKPAGKRTARATAEDISGGGRTAEQPAAQGSSGLGQGQPQLAVTPAQAARSQTSAAIGGLVTAVLTLAVVASTFAFQMAYEEYFTCQQDALTQSSQDDCQKLLPEKLRPFLENRGG